METQLTPVEVFYSFAEADAPLLEQLERHLSVLRHEEYISTWHKRQIAAGSDWRVELDRHLNAASLILLLISPDFLASDYLYGVGLQRAMERHDENEACVIPILLRPCDWKGTPFEKLQVIPRNGMPLTEWSNLDAGFTEVAQEIRATLQTLTSSPFSTPVFKRSLWNVPHRRNPYFTGRDELFNQLDQYLAPIEQTASVESRRVALTQPHAIKGLGGIGKTQIAVEYAYRSRDLDRYTHTLWINAASSETIIASFVSIAQLLPRLSARHETDQHKLVEAVKRWLEQCQQRWLLIFDNADDVALLHDYLPQSNNGSILLTTRAHAVGGLATSVEVETMGFVEGTQFLLRRAQRFEHASDEEFNQGGNIVVALDHFPLALDQAGAYIEETGCSFVDYLALYQSRRQDLLAQRGEQVVNYPDSVATTWLLSFQKVQQANPAAAELLQLCSFLAPDRIPEELLREGAMYWPTLLQQAVADPLQFQQLMADLLKFSLVKRHVENGILSVHRLVQVVQRESIEPEMQRQWAERVVRAVEQVVPADPDDVTTWPQCLHYLDQAQACNDLIASYQFTFIEAIALLNRVGGYLVGNALYPQAEPLHQRALALCEQQLGPQHPRTATSLERLAIVYKDQGKYAEAEPLYQRALRIREQQLGPQHPDTAAGLNSLATLYDTQGKYAQAELLYQRALPIYEQQLGAEHPRTATCLNNLASLYTDQGKYAEAEPLYQRALRIREQQLGPQHPHTALSLDHLASLYTDQGKYAEAEPLYQRALRIREQQLGPQHPDTAGSLNNLACLYSCQGKYAQAEPLYQRALHIWEQQLGTEHPNTISSLNNLADLYRLQGKYAQAELLYQRALGIREQQLGPEHPDIATSLNNLASLYRLQGKYVQAEHLYQRAWSICKQQFGENHPHTAGSLNNLAWLSVREGKFEQAEPLYQQALAIYEQLLGSDHPRTALILSNLADLYRLQGKYAQAEALYQRALCIREQQLGPEHPSLAYSLTGLANLCCVRENYSEAESLFQRALFIRERAFVPHHPDIAETLDGFAVLRAAQGNMQDSAILYQRAFAIREAVYGPGHPKTKETHEHLQAVLAELQRGKTKPRKTFSYLDISSFTRGTLDLFSSIDTKLKRLVRDFWPE
jgi:tetratricopeptide (TPR) repeat protein